MMKSNRWLTDINLWPPYSIIGTHTGKMNVMALRKYLCGGTHQTVSPKLVLLLWDLHILSQVSHF